MTWALLAAGIASGQGVRSAAAQTPAPPAAEPTVPSVMQETEKAIARIKIIEYRFAQRGAGEGADKPPRIEGRAVLSGYAGNMWIKKFRLDAKMRLPGESEASNFVAGSDGDLIYVFDEKQKKVHADIDPAVLGSNSMTVLETLVSNFVNPDPFEYERKAEKSELKPPAQVGDEPCHVLRFKLGGGENEVIWYVSKRDSLPRRFDWNFKAPTGEVMGASTLLSDIRVNATYAADPFKLTVPEGYTRTDDFAP